MTVYIIAFCLYSLGYALRYWAIKHLKENFSVRIKEPDYVVITGPYKFCKHPMYVGSVLMLTGITLVSLHLAIVVLSIMFFIDRATRENEVIERKIKNGCVSDRK